MFSQPYKRRVTANSHHPVTLDPYDSPRSLNTPTCHRISIGPTPQKNGIVLGLFDLLSPASALKSLQTPSKPSLRNTQDQHIGTPSKLAEGVAIGQATGNRVEDSGSVQRPSRTPNSSSKRMYLDSFLTPSARRNVSRQQTPSSKSKGKTSRKLFAADETPEFLKRNSQRAGFSAIDSINDNEISWSPIAIRMPSKPAGKGLSALVRNLRGMQDEALDEDLEMLREMETEESRSDNINIGKTKIVKQRPQLLVRDSQAEVDMPLGPDGASRDEVESSDEKILQRRDGKLKVWKKKGQKRSTMRANMKPSVAAWKPEPAWQDSLELSRGSHESPVESTQIDEGGAGRADIEKDRHGGGNHEGSERRRERQEFQTVVRSDTKSSVEQMTKQTKKTNPTAHPNFRALKIKNRQSKGKRGGRFGRKR